MGGEDSDSEDKFLHDLEVWLNSLCHLLLTMVLMATGV